MNELIPATPRVWKEGIDKSKYKVLDWVKCAQILREQGIRNACVGIGEDMYYTGAKIISRGKPVLDARPYVGSKWGTPVIQYGRKTIECWKYMGECEWNPDTVWPQEALDAYSDVTVVSEINPIENTVN